MNGTEKLEESVYLGMKESDVFVDGLAKPICSWQGIIPSDEVEYRVCSKISGCVKWSNLTQRDFKSIADPRIHDLDDKGIEAQL
jgi:hypothetical protein